MNTKAMPASFVVLDLTGAGKSIRCLICGTTSYNPNDVAQRYCGFCHVFHDDVVSTYLREANNADTDSSKRRNGEHQ